jgi:hypothetical protein
MKDRNGNNRLNVGRLLTVAMLVVLLASGIGWSVKASLTAEAAYDQGKDNEVRLRVVEKNIAEISADIRVMRTLMEQEHRGVKP